MCQVPLQSGKTGIAGGMAWAPIPGPEAGQQWTSNHVPHTYKLTGAERLETDRYQLFNLSFTDDSTGHETMLLERVSLRRARWGAMSHHNKMAHQGVYAAQFALPAGAAYALYRTLRD